MSVLRLKHETISRIAALLAEMGEPPGHIGPLPGENGIRLEFRSDPSTEQLETLITRVGTVYSLACERFSWAPEFCRIIVRGSASASTPSTAWTIRREWLPSGPAEMPNEDESREMLEKIEASQEVL